LDTFHDDFKQFRLLGCVAEFIDHVGHWQQD
jgi:hypothetical protein